MHVEVPTWGSVLLAGVIIKIGLYGMDVLVRRGLDVSFLWGVGL